MLFDQVLVAFKEHLFLEGFQDGVDHLIQFKRNKNDIVNSIRHRFLGKLKIPGYSNYLHPYDETHLIGIGKDVDASIDADKVHDPNAVYYTAVKGVKLSLFDVSDVSNPKEVAKVAIGERGTDSEALYKHKAFLFSKEKGLLVIPATVYDEWNYKYNGAYVFSLDLENGFKLKGTITHEDESQQKQGYADWLATVRRSLYMENTLYTISQRKIRANDLSSENLTEIKTIDLPVKEQIYPIYYASQSS